MKSDNNDIESELHDLGYPIGQRVLELSVYRDKALNNGNNICQYGRRECKSVNLLHFINNQIWKMLFGRPADGIEQSVDDENEYRIIELNPVTNTFISSGHNEGTGQKEKVGSAVAENFGPNCASFLAGMIEGILVSSKMNCKVSAHFVPEEDENDDNYSAEDDNGKKPARV